MMVTASISSKPCASGTMARIGFPSCRTLRLHGPGVIVTALADDPVARRRHPTRRPGQIVTHSKD
jgi:hypothetical protein